MADNNIFVYIFPSNKKWREKCGTFFLILFRSKSFFVRNISLEKWAVESALKVFDLYEEIHLFQVYYLFNLLAL